MGDITAHLDRAEAALSEAQAAPLSVRKALLCAALIDDLPGRAFAAWRDQPRQLFGAEDTLAFRRALRGECAELGLLSDLCGMAEGAPRLVVKSVTVAATDYADLPVEDYMVSLYNQGTVQRVIMTAPSGDRLGHEILAEALRWWRARV